MNISECVNCGHPEVNHDIPQWAGLQTREDGKCFYAFGPSPCICVRFTAKGGLMDAQAKAREASK